MYQLSLQHTDPTPTPSLLSLLPRLVQATLLIELQHKEEVQEPRLHSTLALPDLHKMAIFLLNHKPCGITHSCRSNFHSRYHWPPGLIAHSRSPLAQCRLDILQRIMGCHLQLPESIATLSIQVSQHRLILVEESPIRHIRQLGRTRTCRQAIILAAAFIPKVKVSLFSHQLSRSELSNEKIRSIIHVRRGKIKIPSRKGVFGGKVFRFLEKCIRVVLIAHNFAYVFHLSSWELGYIHGRETWDA